MNTVDLLKSHSSIRKYKDTTIAQAVLDDILEAGMRGSNTGNMQIYSVVVTRDAQRKKELAKFHFNQPMVASAAAVITVCIDINRWDK
ncbi:MAG: nitroreductase family protein, partial [Bacteroidales bacterium]|nr:nitroreductase family protein [Bacteroidales bacterium]